MGGKKTKVGTDKKYRKKECGPTFGMVLNLDAQFDSGHFCRAKTRTGIVLQRGKIV